MYHNNSTKTPTNSFSFSFDSLINEDLPQVNESPDPGVSLSEIGAPILPAPSHIPGLQPPITKRSASISSSSSSEIPSAISDSSTLLNLQNASAPKIFGETEVIAAIERIKAENPGISKIKCIQKLREELDLPAKTRQKKLASHLCVNSKWLSITLQQQFNKKTQASEAIIKKALSEIKAKDEVATSLDIHQKIADALGYTEKISNSDDITKMLEGSGISKYFYKRILGHYKKILLPRVSSNPNIENLKNLIAQVKSQPDANNITRREAERRIILLAEQQGREPYSGNIRTSDLASYLNISETSASNYISKAFGNLTQEERDETNTETQRRLGY